MAAPTFNLPTEFLFHPVRAEHVTGVGRDAVNAPKVVRVLVGGQVLTHTYPTKEHGAFYYHSILIDWYAAMGWSDPPVTLQGLAKLRAEMESTGR